MSMKTNIAHLAIGGTGTDILMTTKIAYLAIGLHRAVVLMTLLAATERHMC